MTSIIIGLIWRSYNPYYHYTYTRRKKHTPNAKTNFFLANKLQYLKAPVYGPVMGAFVIGCFGHRPVRIKLN